MMSKAIDWPSASVEDLVVLLREPEHREKAISSLTQIKEGHKVCLNVYDLSQGMARQLSMTFLGKVIEGIWHTGIVVYGTEYYFSGGVQQAAVGTTQYGTPVRVYMEMYKMSIEDPAGFWSEIAAQFYWKCTWDPSVYSGNLDVRKGNVNIKCFEGGITNICYNCLDRNIESENGDKIAIYWEGNEPGADASLTYTQLLQRVCQLANYLKDIGVKKGDAVLIYLPMLMELPIAMLACARIGAVHSVVFAGFSAESVAQRISDCKPKVLITCNVVMQGSKLIRVKQIVDAALTESSKNGFSLGAETALVFMNAVVPRLKSWIHKVRSEKEEDLLTKTNKETSLAATDVARASQDMLIFTDGGYLLPYMMDTEHVTTFIADIFESMQSTHVVDLIVHMAYVHVKRRKTKKRAVKMVKPVKLQSKSVAKPKPIVNKRDHYTIDDLSQ
ncbi:hypothetical protein AgCh_014870 [Apium graveolens]